MCVSVARTSAGHAARGSAAAMIICMLVRVLVTHVGACVLVLTAQRGFDKLQGVAGCCRVLQCVGSVLVLPSSAATTCCSVAVNCSELQ